MSRGLVLDGNDNNKYQFVFQSVFRAIFKFPADLDEIVCFLRRRGSTKIGGVRNRRYFSSVQDAVTFVPFSRKVKKMELRDLQQCFQQRKLHTRVVGFFRISTLKISEINERCANKFEKNIFCH